MCPNGVFRAIDEILERLGVLIALRKASESTPPGLRIMYHASTPCSYIMDRETQAA